MRVFGRAAVVVAAAWSMGSVALAGSFAEREVRYRSGEITLTASLLLPEGAGPFAAAVMLQGSGPSDRSNLWARSIAEALATRGIAVIYPDKRGSGKSEGDWRTAGFDELADDALAAIPVLLRESKVDPKRIGLVGLSQGGKIAPLAAAKDPRVAFVIDLVGSTVSFVDQVTHEMEQTARGAGLDQSGVRAVMEIHHRAGEYLRSGAWAPYQAKLDAAKGTPWERIASGFPQREDAWQWSWLRKVIDYDPMVYWKQVTQPSLIVFGGQDERDNVPVAASVRRVNEELAERPNVVVTVYPSSGHALYDQSGKFREDLAEYLVWFVEKAISYKPLAVSH